jgi:hypothetical protein
VYSTPFKRTSSVFGSRLWSDLPLPIDECNDNDFDFPMLRKKSNNSNNNNNSAGNGDNEKGWRVTSLQPNASQKMLKQPLARHISSPTRFNYSMKVKDTNRISDTSFASKMSFRGFIRRMSEKRRRPTAESDFMRERRKAIVAATANNKTISIRFNSIRLVIFFVLLLFFFSIHTNLGVSMRSKS